MHHGNLLVILLGVCVNAGLLFEAWLTCHCNPIKKEDVS